jgi:hypothetical protein
VFGPTDQAFQALGKNIVDFVANGFNSAVNDNVLTVSRRVRGCCQSPRTSESSSVAMYPLCHPVFSLQYHVAAGATYASQLYNGEKIPTLDKPYTVGVTIAGGKVQINTATVIQANLNASNGVLHIIDGVRECSVASHR